MTINNVIDLARGGELSNLAVKDDETTILGFINLGLIELYKRFPIKVSEHIVELQDGVSEYTLPDDCMWLVAAYGEVKNVDLGNATNELPINVEDDPMSINTVGWNTIQVPFSINGAYISLIYVASPTYVTEASLDSTIAIPPQMVEALLHYIGYRAHGSIDGNIDGENNTHYQRFELSCRRIEERGMYTSDDLDMMSRNMKGLV